MEYPGEETGIIPSKASFSRCPLKLQEPISKGYVIYQNPIFHFPSSIPLTGKTASKHRYMIF